MPTNTRTPSPGPVACSETGECLTAPTGVYRVENGEFILLDVILPETDDSMSEEIGMIPGGG